ncbi:glycoside hydrolase family 16 protein [Geodermatophilus amargosae]|nr:glycoside hydrolase family 16 protein [Geodermatophilus amargosae]
MSASTPPPPASTPPPPASTAPSTTSQAPSAGTSPAPAQTGGPSTGTFTGLPVAPAGWQQVYADDFSVDASSAQVGRSYPRLTLYPDNSGGGKYQTELVDVSGGTLRMGVQGSGGQAQGSALTITNPTTQWGQTYGRYSIRFRADRASDSGAAMMLWPDSDVWSDGETDCVEGDFDGTIHSFNHRVGANPEQNSLAVDTGMSWQDWHVSTVEWTPTAIRFYLDGQLIGTDTSAVARASRHWVIQTAGTGSGSLQIDWVAMYQYTG